MFITFSKLHCSVVHWHVSVKIFVQGAKDIEDKQQRHAWER